MNKPLPDPADQQLPDVHAEHHPQGHPATARGHESSDIGVRLFARIGLLFLAAGVVFLVGLYFLFGLYEKERRRTESSPSAFADLRPAPPDPRLQPSPGHDTSPTQDMQQFLEQENRRATTYGWIDRQNGVVRIPISSAMKMVMERGLPTRPQQAKEGQ